MKHPFLLVWLTLIVLCGCTSSGKQKRHVIGLSQCMLDDAWREAMINDMRIEASNYDDVEIIIKDAQNNNETQIQQIRDLIRQKVDVLIISPYQSEPITAVAEEAYRAGIPTIITDRKVNTDQYTSFVGANNYEIGLAAGNYAAHYLPPNAIILEIWGLTQTSPAQERHKGFVDALREREDLSFRKIEGQWLVDTARMELRKLEHPEQIDFVYAHNDMMAIAAREYFMAWDSIRGRDLRIIGVDAVAGAGLEAVEDGRINASFLYPTGGEQVIRTAMRIIQGEPVDKFIPLRTAPVDHQSARTLLLQADQLQKYKQRIEAQRSRIDGLSDRFYFLRNSLGVISLLMIGFIALSIYAFYINRKMRQANRKLISLNAEMKEVTAQKLQFFTNVSHEVRTPLTLILAPLDRLIVSLRESPYASDLGLIQKNANRLLRVINQILDFRKIQNGKMRLHVSLFNLNEMVDSFEKEFRVMAEENEVSFTFQLAGEDIMVWADKEKVAIVIRNIISNAFKFTPAGGNIYVTMGVSDDDKHCYVRVEDSGVGIPQSKLSEIFERFSQADNARGAYYQGTGIGLALSKEIISLHHGEIYAESLEGKGAVFTIELQLGKEHYKPSEVDFYMGGETVSVPETESVSASAGKESEEEKEQPVDSSLPTVLIVEDNKDLCNMLKLQLEDKFNIYMANDGVEGLKKVHLYHPDMVVTDQMMPNMDGIEMLQRIRKDFQISHIPVIILTAKGNDEAKTKAISMGANAYIIKPFSKDYLVARIEQLLNERKLFRERVWQQPEEHKEEQDTYEQFLVEKDVQFIEKIHQVIEENLDNSDFNIDTIASTIGLSRSAFFKKLKSLTGFAPVDLVKEIRLNKSIELIKNSDMSISEIAFAVGFKDSGYFSKCFRKKYDQTPREYMNEWRKG